jgi:hypothetical protein
MILTAFFFGLLLLTTANTSSCSSDESELEYAYTGALGLRFGFFAFALACDTGCELLEAGGDEVMRSTVDS